MINRDIKLPDSHEIRNFVRDLNASDDGPYLVSSSAWQEHIANNKKCENRIPEHITAGSYVITNSYEFRELIKRIGNLHIESQRLLTNIGPIWGAVKLEIKKGHPKGDIFDYGHRQPGSFRSGG